MVIVFRFGRRYAIRLVLKTQTIMCNVLVLTRPIGLFLKVYGSPYTFRKKPLIISNVTLNSYLKVGIYSYEPYTTRELQTSAVSNVTTHVVKTINFPTNAHYPYLSSAEVGIGTPRP